MDEIANKVKEEHKESGIKMLIFTCDVMWRKDGKETEDGLH
jgi:hypothetical protein